MRGSRNFCQAGGGGGGEGVEARRPENSLDNVFFSHQLILQLTECIQWFYYRGEEGVQLLPGGGGVHRNTHITCDFPEEGGGGPDPLIPLWFAYRIMVYQNLNKTEKYHPTTKRKKSYLLLVEIASADPEGGPDPLENYKLYGFLYGISNWTPLEKVGPPLEP